MKKIFTLLIFLFTLLSNAQNLTLDELVSLRKKTLVNVEEILSSKGWNYIEGNSPTSLDLGLAVFAYKKSSFDDKAKAFITYYYSQLNSNIEIRVQINNKEKYSEYLNRIKTLGGKLIESDIYDGKIYKVYQGKTTTFKIEISTKKEQYSSSTKTIYHFTLIDNKSYNKMSLYKDLVVLDTLVDLVDINEKFDTSTEIINKQELNKDFFIGTWSFNDFKITFYEDNNSKIIFKNNTTFEQDWEFYNNKITLKNKTFFIIDTDTNSFEYKTSKNGESQLAFRVGH